MENAYHKNEDDLQKELLQVEAARTDAAKFDVLYDRYYKPVYHFVFRRVNDEDICSDLTSMVFLKALMNIRKYEYRGVPFSAWLYRIAFNEINMYFRKNRTDRVVSLESGQLREIASEVQEPDNSDAEKKMLSVLRLLKEDEIQLIEMRFFEKRAFAEIGLIIGITENNAKVKLYRILEKMKKLLERAGMKNSSNT